MEIKLTKDLTPIGTFKCNVPEEYMKRGWANPRQDGILFTDENGNMVAGLRLYLAPNDYWDDGGAPLNAVLVIKNEDVYEIDIDSEEAKRYVKWYNDGAF